MQAKFRNIIFDDIIDYDGGITLWSQICDKCAKKYNIENNLLDLNSGNGICGVEGCENEADHYIDFPDKEIEIIPIYHTDCENCGATIKEGTENYTNDIKDYTVCDSCEATICIDCIGEFNECPVCGEEITVKENF